MSSDTSTTHDSPATCEGCGSILVIFEEHPDGEVIYCACRCAIEANAARVNRPPEAVGPFADAAARATSLDHCASCGAAFAVIGSRPDGSPVFSECPCRPKARPSEPPKISRPVDRPASIAQPELQTSSVRTWLLSGVAAFVFVAALAGFLARGREHAGTQENPSRESAAPAGTLSLIGDVKILNDDSGAVMMVSGTDPREVLRAFCRNPQFHSALVPGGVQAAVPPDPDRLVGSAMLMDGTGAEHQVILSRDPKTKRWSIGDGTSPIAIGTPSAAQ